MSENIIEGFSQRLFWDVDRNLTDVVAHRKFLIQRVLEYGTLTDWTLLKQTYGLESIIETAINLRSLDPKAMAFISAISDIPVNQFRCCTQEQSSPTHWSY